MNKIKEEIITMLHEHSRIIYDVLSDMSVFYAGWAEASKQKNLHKKQAKMQLLEEDADSIKIKLIKKFAEAGTQGLGGYIGLILKMDNVINSALEFVDILNYLDSKINQEIKKRYEKLLNKIMEMADVLKTTIKNLRDNPDGVFENTTQVHELENEIDIIFHEFLNYLYENKDLEIRKLLRIRDSIIILEELADRIHDIADEIRILLYQ
ncbi:MAG: DUF47 family protein [Promethearchaeota archaeon]|nr:MAG: DUF47 family protein [Candidatus Lokiarchaeota archaeon]